MRWLASADRRLRDQGVELAAIAAVALLAPFVPWVQFFAVYVFVGFLIVRTRNVRRQFYEPELTDWLRVLGAVTRGRFAAWYLRDLALRSAVHAVALTLLVVVWRRVDVGGNPLDGLPLPAGVAGVLAVLFGLQVALRGVFGIWRHVGSCTWIAPRVRGIANRSTPGRAAQLAFLLDALVLGVLLAPFVAVIASSAFWVVAPLALAYAALLYAMVRASEAVEASGNPALSFRELLGRREGAQRLGARSRSVWRSLLWTGLRPSARAAVVVAVPMAVLTVLSLVVEEEQLPSRGARRVLMDGLSFAAAALHVLLLFACAVLAAETPFRWQSRGATAEYLHACGVDLGRQRRIELAAGALLCVPVVLAALFATVWSPDPETALMLLPGAALLFARCIRDTLPLGGRRLEVRTLAAGIGFALVAIWLVVAVSGIELPRELDSRPDLLRWILAPFVLGAPALWLRAWIRSGDEDRLKREFERTVPAGKRAIGA